MTSLSFTRHSIDHSLWFCQQLIMSKKLSFILSFACSNCCICSSSMLSWRFSFLLVVNRRREIHNVSNQDQIANCTPCTNRYHGNKRCNYVLQEHKKEQRIESPCDRTLQTDDPPVVKWLLMVIPPDLTENALHHKCRQKFQRRCKKRSQEKQQYTIVAIRT